VGALNDCLRGNVTCVFRLSSNVTVERLEILFHIREIPDTILDVIHSFVHWTSL
jgi:hypothetical protein